MYRPDVIQNLLTAGSLTATLEMIDSAPAKVDSSAETTPPDSTPAEPIPEDVVQASQGKEDPNPAEAASQETESPAQLDSKPDADDSQVERVVRQTKPKRVVDILPPRVRLLSPELRDVKTTEKTIVIEAEAIADSRRPVTSMRLLVNSGPDELSIRDLDPLTSVAQRGLIREVKYPAQRWEITLGSGTQEFVVRADSGTGANATYGLSSTIRVTYKDSKPKLYLLAVGVSAYSGDLALKYAHSDADGFVQTLREHAEGEEKPYQSVTAKVLTNQLATKARIMAGIRWLREQVRMGDLAIVFFAGHGVPHEGRFYLLPVDGDLDDLPNTAISKSDLEEFYVATSGGARRILVIDACYSGALDPAETFRKFNSDDLGVYVMTSANEQERSWESDDLRGGVFTSWMNRGLAGEARLGDEFVDDWDLGKYVMTAVYEFTKQKKLPTRQTPQFLRPTSDLPLVLTRPTSN